MFICKGVFLCFTTITKKKRKNHIGVRVYIFAFVSHKKFEMIFFFFFDNQGVKMTLCKI